MDGVRFLREWELEWEYVPSLTRSNYRYRWWSVWWSEGGVRYLGEVNTLADLRVVLSRVDPVYVEEVISRKSIRGRFLPAEELARRGIRPWID